MGASNAQKTFSVNLIEEHDTYRAEKVYRRKILLLQNQKIRTINSYIALCEIH